MADLAARGYYVYGVVSAGRRPSATLRGLDDEPVEYLEDGGLAAVVGPISLDRPPGRSADLMAHDRVVAGLADEGAVVPAQFGSVLESRQAVLDHLLVAQHDRLTHLLRRLEGSRQFLVRARYREEQVLAEVVRDNPVVAELRERTRHLPEGTPHPDLIRLGEEVAAAVERLRSADAATVEEAVLPHVLEHRRRPDTALDHVVTLSVRVDDDARGAFEDALETLAEGVHERIRVQLSGPLPAYDFVEEGPWD